MLLLFFAPAGIIIGMMTAFFVLSASSEQSKGIEQISSALTQLDQVVQQNASTPEEVAASAEELSSQSTTVKATIGILTSVNEGGQQAA